MPPTPLPNKNVLLTGASGGIAPHIARRLAQSGANLGLVARRLEPLTKLAAELSAAFPVSVIAIPADITHPDERRTLLAEFEQRLGPVDILINNAGAEHSTLFAQQPDEHILAMLRLNLEAPLLLCRLVLPGMIARRQGWIVNHASLAGAVPPPYSAIYAATKAGLIAWNQAIQHELDGSGVHASALITTYVAEAGLHARRGMPGHWLAGEVSPERVAAAVLQVLNGKREIYITRGPMRPLHALSILFPGGRNWLFRRVRLYEYLRKRAEK